MADFDIAINLKVTDPNSAEVIKGLKGNLRGLEGELGRAFGGRGRRGGSKMLDDFANGVSQAGAAVNDLTRASRGVLEPIINEGVQFERSMSEVLAFGGTKFAPFMDQLKEQARELGATTEFTAVDAAQSMRQLAQAGLSPVEIMGQLPTIMDLAKADAMGLAGAAKTVASTMAQFGVDTKNAADVADILAVAANASQVSVSDMAQSLSFTGTSADLLGFDLEKTAVILAALGKTAITSGKAGRWTDAMFLGLSKLTSPSLRKGLRQIGIDQKVLSSNLAKQDIGAILKQFKTGFEAKGLGGVENAAKRLTILRKIFGAEGARAFSSLMKTSELGTFDKLTGEIHQFGGAAKEMGRIMTDNVQGDLKKFDSALSEIKLQIADELLPAMRPLLADATKAAVAFGKWADENRDLIRDWGPLLIKLTAAGVVLGPILNTVGSLATALSLVGKAARSEAAAGMLKFATTSSTVNPALSSMIGSTTGKLGILGAVAAAGMLGFEVGTLIDDMFGFSDSLSGVNTELSIHNALLEQNLSLQIGLKTLRQGSAKLGSLTEEEQAKLKAAQSRKEALSAELAEAEDSETGIMGGAGGGFMVAGPVGAAIGFGISKLATDSRSTSDIQADIQRAEKEIEAIDKAGRSREMREADRAAREAAMTPDAPVPAGKQGNMDEFIQALNEHGFGKAQIKVIVDQQNRFIGVEGMDDTGAGNGTLMEGM